MLAVSMLAAAAMAEDKGPWANTPGDPDAPAEVEALYPGLASGVLTHARLVDLPEGVLLRSGDVSILASELAESLANAPESVAAELKKNALFVLEQMAEEKLIVHEARKSLGEKEAADESALIRSYLNDLLSGISVTDEEVLGLYRENTEMFGGAPFDQVKTYLRQQLVREKQQAATEDHIRTLGERTRVEVSAGWVKEQAALMRDNPVDRMRAGGKPSMVDFGSEGCVPCDMMAPILETVRKKYEGRVNILFVHVNEEQILAARYGIRSIPVQVFFDKDGKEVFRHTGFLPQEEIEKKLAEMGVE